MTLLMNRDDLTRSARTGVAGQWGKLNTKARRLRHALSIPGALVLVAVAFVEVLGVETQILLNSHPKVLLALAALAALMLYLANTWAAQLPTSGTTGEFGQDGDTGLPARRGLVLLVGLDSADPASAAAEVLTAATGLEYVAFIGDSATAELGITETLAGKIAPAAGLHLPASHQRRWEFGHAESVADAEEAVSEALRWMTGRGVAVEDVVVDISAGRRPMGYGANQAADRLRVETHYLTERWDRATNQPVPGTRQFKVVQAFHAR